MNKEIDNAIEKLKDLPMYLKDVEGWFDNITTIKSHIQSQQDRIKELEDKEWYEIDQTKETITMPKAQFEKFERELIDKVQKLDKIEEVVTPSNIDYILGSNGDIITKILEILAK